MKLYSVNDVHDYYFLANKYHELANMAERVMRERENEPGESIEVKFALTQIKSTKDMMDSLGTEVPDDKAKELGFVVA